MDYPSGFKKNISYEKGIFSSYKHPSLSGKSGTADLPILYYPVFIPIPASAKPVWVKGPHIFQKDGWYYLICAEGGTGDNHSEVAFRSKKADGPYESYIRNPILTQRHLDPERTNLISTTGHAQFAETKDGKWYAVLLGCRPYEGSYYNTGRETFMAPVQWKDGWPVILEGKAEMQYHYPVPIPSLTKKVVIPIRR